MTKKTDLDRKKFPEHVAIIMDGNGRWAAERSLPRAAGHKQGVTALRTTVRAAAELGIKVLTVYSFSSENWSRPQAEIKYLFKLLERFVRQDVAELHSHSIRIKIIGERSNLTRKLVKMLEYCEDLTKDNTAMTLVVAFNYGARNEMTSAVKAIARQVENGEIRPEEITEQHIAAQMGTSGIPDPDLLIRTSGEQRLSNFLLWQCAYTEFVFVRQHWPSFNSDVLESAIEEFRSRDRRYGGLASGTG